MADKETSWTDVAMTAVERLNPTFGKSRRMVLDAWNKYNESKKPSYTDSPIPTLNPENTRMAHKGGRVKKDGIFTLRKGEIVIPAKIAKRMEKRKPGRKSGRR